MAERTIEDIINEQQTISSKLYGLKADYLSDAEVAELCWQFASLQFELDMAKMFPKNVTK